MTGRIKILETRINEMYNPSVSEPDPSKRKTFDKKRFIRAAKDLKRTVEKNDKNQLTNTR